jgi:hypothetical protein
VKVEKSLFLYLGVFYIPVATVYGFMTHWHEPLGFLALYLTSGMAFLIGFYLTFTARHIDPRPEDDYAGEISQGAGEVGSFPPYSWWPLALAMSAACVFAGLAVGWWLFAIGIPLAAVSVVGWVFEYYRGQFAH